MNTIYSNSHITMRVLDERYSQHILDFYTNNRLYFDIYEIDKPTSFYSLDFIKQMTKAEYNAFVQGTFIRYFLFANNNPEQIIGCISFSDIKKSMLSCTIGYKIDKNYQNLGYGRRMLTMALKIMVTECNIHRIEAYIHPCNLASLHLVKALGFIGEGTAYAYAKINGQWVDHLRFVYIS